MRESRDASVLVSDTKKAAESRESHKAVRVSDTGARPKRPSELERVEAEIARQEGTVADLERRLAEDWSDVELLAAHRSARDQLQALLQRWESLFEEAQA
jgi:uncharacterized coiled-coil protein SlyX